MRSYFFSGLAILLPFAITLIVVLFILNFLTRPFEGAVESILRYYDIFDKPFLFLNGAQVLGLASKLLVLVAIFLLTLFIGVLGQSVITKTFFTVGDYFIHKIPLISKVYKATQEVVHTVFKTDSTAFSQVVLIPFPHKNVYSIGLITAEEKKHIIEEEQAHAATTKVSVFVPGTPNPTMGFMLMFDRSQLVEIDMKVEDALKFVVSCGIMFPGYKKL